MNLLMKERPLAALIDFSVCCIIGLAFLLTEKLSMRGQKAGDQLPCGEVLISPPAVPTLPTNSRVDRKERQMVRHVLFGLAIRWCSIPFHFSPHRMRMGGGEGGGPGRSNR